MQRSAQYGLGTALCWIDGAKEQGKKVQGYWSQPYSIGRCVVVISHRGLSAKPCTRNRRSFDIAEDAQPGKHILTCELLSETADPGGGKEFRIISVMR